MTRIEHFAIFARDLEATRRFYQDTFGMRVLLDNSRAAVRGYFLGDTSGGVLEVIERPADVAAQDTRHMCHTAFHVDDYAATRAALEESGVAFEPETAIDTPEFKTCFFRDPDGNRCQVVWRSQALGG
jgi:glyoxylase I family protein